MNAPLYTTEILRLAASLSDPRALEREDGRAELRSPTCGSRIALERAARRERRVERLSQQVQACAFGQASAALVERHSRRPRRTTSVARRCSALSRWLPSEHDDDERLAGHCGARAGAPTGRHGAILLPFRALLAAIEAAR